MLCLMPLLMLEEPVIGSCEIEVAQQLLDDFGCSLSFISSELIVD